MSVRIHQLSKQIGIENKELIELLRSRGFEVKSSSSTIDNISAESLVEEFTKINPVEESKEKEAEPIEAIKEACLLYTSPSPRDYAASRMPSSA